MAVIVCPVGATAQFSINWPAAARDLTDCTGLSQVRDAPSASGTLLIDGTVTIDTGSTPQTITIELDEADTLTQDEGSRGFMDLRLEWTDGEVQFPLIDDWVELEFTPTITREA